MDVSEKIKILPHNPGVYRFLNKEGKIIYIGKAKDLKKRVSQYFTTPERLTAKTRVLVQNIADIQHTVVESEQDALLLENNLIKEYKPKYNILLKDSKTYPWICISKEPFPRIFLTRRMVRNGSLYFGPYSSVQHAHNLLDLINTLYKIRSCRFSLTPEAIGSGKYKECLDFHIKKMLCPMRRQNFRNGISQTDRGYYKYSQRELRFTHKRIQREDGTVGRKSRIRRGTTL